MTEPDPLLAALAERDPVAVDPPPASGSARDRLILERAMTAATASTATPPATDDGPVVPIDRPRRRPRVRRLVAAAAAALVVVAGLGVLVVVQPDRGPGPVAALTLAAETTGDVESLRIRSVNVDEGGTSTLDAAVDGRDVRARLTYEPGHGDADPDGSEDWVVIVGDQQWSDDDPGPVSIEPDDRPAPYPTASEAVVRAALQGAEVVDTGTEPVRGGEARHYRIRLGRSGVAALAALPRAQTGLFGLEHPERLTALDVWVADDLIRRVAHTFTEGGSEGSARVDFYDIGAAITVEPPG